MVVLYNDCFTPTFQKHARIGNAEFALGVNVCEYVRIVPCERFASKGIPDYVPGIGSGSTTTLTKDPYNILDFVCCFFFQTEVPYFWLYFYRLKHIEASKHIPV